MKSQKRSKATGATALFDEKYGDEVRVVTMGDVSKEFCAGCHVNNTSEIGVCKIVSEESIGSDTRRITAKTGLSAYDEFAAQQKMLENIAVSAKSKGIQNIDSKVDAAYDKIKAQEKEIEELKNQIFALKSLEWAAEAKEVNGIHLLIKQISGMDASAIKDIAANLKGNDPAMVCFFAVENNGRLVFVAGAGKDAVAKGINAGALVKEAAKLCSGNGGGKPDLAQAGGKDIASLPAALNKVQEMASAA